MGLPIWRTPPPSPRPVAAQLSDANRPTRTAIRRRVSPRASPRDQARRFPDRYMPALRSPRRSSSSSQRIANVVDNTTLQSINARLDELAVDSSSLTILHRELQIVQRGAQTNGSSRQSSSRSPSDLAAAMSDYAHSRDDASRPEIASLSTRYDRGLARYQSRLMRIRVELQRLEDGGMNLREQRGRLFRMHNDFYQRHLNLASGPSRSHSSRREQPENDYGTPVDSPPSPVARATREDSTSSTRPTALERQNTEAARPTALDWTNPPFTIGAPISTHSSTHFPDRITLSPQPMPEHMSAGAVRLTSANRILGPEMELPPLRRMGDRSIASVDATDGLGDRLRSPSSDYVPGDWEPMLSSIAPDERLPSASSSFATSAASMSFSEGRDSQGSSRAASAFSGPDSVRTSITEPDEEKEEIWLLIGDRLNRGDDVPDEMWLNAGAPRAVARALARQSRAPAVEA